MPFTSDEQEFIKDVAQAATGSLSMFLPAASGNFRTKSIIRELEEAQAFLKAELKSEEKKTPSADVQGELKSETLSEERKDEGGEPDQGEESKDNHGEVKDSEESDGDEQDGAEEKAEGAENEEEVLDEAEQLDDVDDGQREMQTIGKLLKRQQKKVANLQIQFQKCQTRLEKQAAKLTKLEKQIVRSKSMLNHLCKFLTAVLDIITKHKDEVFGQVKQCLFPTAPVHRALKALLHVLGYSDAVVHDWTKSRKVLCEEICKMMREYSSLSEMDLKKWDLSDIFLDGLTEAQLSEEAPAGYLAQQWLLAAKKVAFETVKCSDHKAKREKATKDFADVELEQMVAEIDLRVSIDEEKKLTLQLEDLQSKFAQELSPGPNNKQLDQNAEEEDAEE